MTTDCKYIGWKGRDRWCRHPNHVAPITKPCAGCREYVHEDVKHMPGEVPPWPYPVSLVEKNA